MPIVEDSVPHIVRAWFEEGCRKELTQADIETECFSDTYNEARAHNEEVDRINAYRLKQALENA